MKSLFFAIILSVLTFSTSAFADVKIKSKQTMSGQTYENTTYIKGKRQRTETMNGMMISLTQCDLQRGVQINPQSKTYMVNPFQTETTTTTATTADVKQEKVTKGGTVTSTITTKDTGERKQMFGYTAKHLIITMETVSSPDACTKTNSKMQFDGWYIDAEFALDCDQNTRYQNYSNNKQGGCQDKYEMKQIGTAKRGYPVYEKMTMLDESGKETFSTVTEVLEFSKSTLDGALFEVPNDYREVKNSTEMYSSMSVGSSNGMSISNSGNNSSGMSISNGSTTLPSSGSSNSGMSQSVQNAANTSSSVSTEVGAKKEGVVRIGLANVKTAAVGEGLNASDLAKAVQNSLGEYLKTPKLELVALEAKLPAAIESEAKEKECDFVVYATVSHKKGGSGGLGMFGKVVAPAVGRVGIGHTGSTIGNVAGQVATGVIVTAGAMSANVKSKDELTLDLKVNTIGGTTALTNQFKAKAKSDGEDIISQVIEQAAQAILNVATGK